ncbi:MAG: sodium-independent anion transporter, partial [Spirulinaceae cyanobacterium]
LGVTSSLAIENAIQEALDSDRHVFIVGAGGKIKRRLQKLGIWQAIPPEHLLMDREAALAKALNLLDLPTEDLVASTTDSDSDSDPIQPLGSPA